MKYRSAVLFPFLQVLVIEEQGPAVLAMGAGDCCLDIFFLVYHFSLLSPSLWETARYRLKYCLKGPFSPNQLTNHLSILIFATPTISYLLYI